MYTTTNTIHSSDEEIAELSPTIPKPKIRPRRHRGRQRDDSGYIGSPKAASQITVSLDGSISSGDESSGNEQQRQQNITKKTPHRKILPRTSNSAATSAKTTKQTARMNIYYDLSDSDEGSDSDFFRRDKAEPMRMPPDLLENDSYLQGTKETKGRDNGDNSVGNLHEPATTRTKDEGTEFNKRHIQQSQEHKARSDIDEDYLSSSNSNISDSGEDDDLKSKRRLRKRKSKELETDGEEGEQNTQGNQSRSVSITPPPETPSLGSQNHSNDNRHHPEQLRRRLHQAWDQLSQNSTTRDTANGTQYKKCDGMFYRQPGLDDTYSISSEGLDPALLAVMMSSGSSKTPGGTSKRLKAKSSASSARKSRTTRSSSSASKTQNHGDITTATVIDSDNSKDDGSDELLQILEDSNSSRKSTGDDGDDDDDDDNGRHQVDFSQYALSPEDTPVLKKPRGRRAKITISFKLVTDHAFRQHEVYSMLNRHHSQQHGLPNYQAYISGLQTIAVKMFATDTFESALSACLQRIGFQYHPLHWVLVSKGVRVYPTTTPFNCDLKKEAMVELYPKAAYERMQALQAQRHQATIHQLAKEEEEYLEYQKLLRERDNNSSSGVGQEHQQQQRAAIDPDGSAEKRASGESLPPPQQAIDAIRLKIRDKEGKDVFLMVATTSKVQAVIDGYKKNRNIAEPIKVTLEFDDEKLNPDMALNETEIEDEDMIMAYYN
ncbi:hypothetical protein H4219_004170 [Mycoemilia scoparia]|uniref:Rad60/SUMO-like domain-containing protein n=1 Tax=Mycoemilia scoparia TaxID=417184 RepID=A0A9W7ZYA9_9FUNG|nr:hypothetical protein H4219_004170 [Mycoemilia scoparia]